MTRIILSNQPIEAIDAIVIDHVNCCFWKGRERMPRPGGRQILNIRFRIMTTLLVSSPYILTWDEMIEAIWGDDSEGGPENPKQHISVTLSQLKPLQNWLGGRVINSFGVGIRFEFYAKPVPKIAVAA